MTDETHVNALNMKYFVLKPRGDDAYAKASRGAMNKFASMIEQEDPELAREVRNWAGHEMAEAYAREKEGLDGRQGNN